MAEFVEVGEERALLLGAQAGDEDAFRRLVELHRPAVHALCYRMLGSFQDAEDAYQDTMLRAWRALDGFDGCSRVLTWLHRIATNVCLNALQRTARRRVLPADLDDAETADAWIGPYPDVVGGSNRPVDPAAWFDERESLELAFVAALQVLPARQRAALILCEVIGFSAAEVAETLVTTTAAVNNALQRARARLDAARPAPTQQALRDALGDGRISRIVDRFATALELGDTEALMGLLADEVVFEMPPYRDCARSKDAVATWWLIPAARPTGLRTVATCVNGQPAVAVYRHDDGLDAALPIAVDVLRVDVTGITRITAFRDPQLFAVLGLPERLPPSAVARTRRTP
jgi:RNA polymerase sigma-70 factor, ECF subfamily